MSASSSNDAGNICYKRNFLSEVIARVDFLSPIKELEQHLPKSLSQKAKLNFPIAEPKKVVAQNVQISQQGVKSVHTEMTEWHFHGKDKDKTLTITPSTVYVRYTVYKSFEILREEFLTFLHEVFGEFPEAQGNRLGLRYVNNITLDEPNPLAWEAYLNNKMLSIFQLPSEGNFFLERSAILS